MLSHHFPPQSGEERRGGGHGEDPEKGRRPHQEGNRVAHSLNLGKREPEKPCQDGAKRQDAGLPDGSHAKTAQSGRTRGFRTVRKPPIRAESTAPRSRGYRLTIVVPKAREIRSQSKNGGRAKTTLCQFGRVFVTGRALLFQNDNFSIVLRRGFVKETRKIVLSGGFHNVGADLCAALGGFPD